MGQPTQLLLSEIHVIFAEEVRGQLSTEQWDFYAMD